MKVLADTSVWWSHFVRARPADTVFARHLRDELILVHPWVHGELILAGIAPSLSRDMGELETAAVAPQDEVERFIRRHRPRGIGWVDVNLLVSCVETGARLWTLDKDLDANARHHRCGFEG